MQKISIPMIGGMHAVTPNPWLIICQYLAVLVVTVIVALIAARYAAHHWQGNKKDVATGYAAISGVYALLLFGDFGFTAQTIRGILLCMILLTASYSDLKSREVADYMSVMVLLTAFIGVSMTDIPGMLLGGLFVSGMMILVTLLSGAQDPEGYGYRACPGTYPGLYLRHRGRGYRRRDPRTDECFFVYRYAADPGRRCGGCVNSSCAL